MVWILVGQNQPLNDLKKGKTQGILETTIILYFERTRSTRKNKTNNLVLQKL